VIEIVPELHAGIDSLEVYSHLWVLFVFNQNTNIQKRQMSKKPFDGLKLLVEPPKAKGAKVGVLSCRTPHRPNPIGLSLCRIVKVENGAITVAGLDCLDGSPILDIKPYLPIIECVPDARVPDWIYQGVDEDKAMTVEWESKVLESSLIDANVRQIVEETLSRDIRSRNQIRIGETMTDRDWEGELRLKGWQVKYSVNKETKVVRIFSLEPTS
jgi:tRNA-Thr(GGU) m(6)t(6)A37 methyltransferase TsaA